MKKMFMSLLIGSLLVGCGVSEPEITEQTKERYEAFQENDTIVYYNDEGEDITEEYKAETSLEDYAEKQEKVQEFEEGLNELVEAGASEEEIKDYFLEWGFKEEELDFWLWSFGL